MFRDAQRHPENYRHLLVRVTGYNAYFTSIGKELQDEIIAARATGCDVTVNRDSQTATVMSPSRVT